MSDQQELFKRLSHHDNPLIQEVLKTGTTQYFTIKMLCDELKIPCKLVLRGTDDETTAERPK